MGHLSIWDPKTGTRRQLLKAHQADILTLAISRDGQSIFSAGVDARITHTHLCAVSSVSKKVLRSDTNAQKASNNTLVLPAESSRKVWIIDGKKKVHSHDIRSLALHPHSQTLISGGVDQSVIFQSPTSNFINMKVQRLPTYSQISPVTYAAEKKIVMSHFDSCLKVWLLGKVIDTKQNSEQTPKSVKDKQSMLHLNYRHLLTLNFKVKMV